MVSIKYVITLCPDPKPPYSVQGTGSEDKAAMELAHARATPKHSEGSTGETDKPQTENIVLNNSNDSSTKRRGFMLCFVNFVLDPVCVSHCNI